MANIYDTRRYGTMAFFIIAITLVALFLYVSNNLVKDLSEQERNRMEIWADATKALVNLGSSDASVVEATDVDFLLRIIEGNRNIPVLLTDDNGNILQHRNFDLPDPIDSLQPYFLSEKNTDFLNTKLANLRNTSNVIDISISSDNHQHL